MCVALVVLFLLGAVWAIAFNNRINTISERLEKFIELLQPMMIQQAEERVSKLSKGLDGLADSLETDLKGDPEAWKIMAPYVKGIRDSAKKLG